MTEPPSYFDQIDAWNKQYKVDAMIVDLSGPIVDPSTVHYRVFESVEAAADYLAAKKLGRQLGYLALLKAIGFAP